MMHDLGNAFLAVARGIFDLLADLRERLALPRHFDRRQMPLRMARYVRRIEILNVMARFASHARRTVSVGAPHDQRLVGPPGISL